MCNIIFPAQHAQNFVINYHLVSDGGDRKQLSKAMFKKLRVTKLPGAITSITLRGRGNQFYVGTAKGQLYQVNFEDFGYTLLSSCHYHEVTDIVFPM